MSIKSELQNLITGNGQTGGFSIIKAAQIYLSGNEIPSKKPENQQQSKPQEEQRLTAFIEKHDFWFGGDFAPESYIGEGAEQKVYRMDEEYVVKLNDAIFYEFWRDYFNSLLIHNYFFKSTQYELLGFKKINDKFYSVVKQRFIQATEVVDLNKIRAFLKFNGFENTRNNDFYNPELGLIFEDLHDENIISQNGIPFFIDTVFYLTENFYK